MSTGVLLLAGLPAGCAADEGRLDEFDGPWLCYGATPCTCVHDESEHGSDYCIEDPVWGGYCAYFVPGETPAQDKCEVHLRNRYGDCPVYSAKRRVDACPPTRYIDVRLGWSCESSTCWASDRPNGANSRTAMDCVLIPSVDDDAQRCECGAAFADSVFAEPVPSCPPDTPPKVTQRTERGWVCLFRSDYGDSCSCTDVRENEFMADSLTAPCPSALTCCHRRPDDLQPSCICNTTDPCEATDDTEIVPTCPPPEAP